MTKPLLFTTGFLGAGKTTLLRALLEELKKRGRSADVILNDFENAEIDASTLPEYTASIAPIAASCACCGSLDELVELCLAARKSEGDVLLIELNGTADPVPLLETFTLLEEKMPFLPRWQVGVVDARHWGQRGAFTALEVRQLETATHWMPTHTKNLSETAVRDLEESIGKINPYGLQVDAEQLAIEIARIPETSATVDGAAAEHTSCDPAMLETPAHRISHRFTGVQTKLPGRFRKEEMIRLLEVLPENVVRAKALVELEEPFGSRWLFEKTGRHPVGEPLPIHDLNRVKPSLVCIGPSLDPDEIRGLVRGQLYA